MEIIIKINQNIEDNYASYEINTSDDAENCLFLTKTHIILKSITLFTRQPMLIYVIW